MKTYTEIAKEEIDKFIMMGFVDKPAGFDEYVAKIYAQQVGEDVRQRCADNAVIFGELNRMQYKHIKVDRKSIMYTEIILP